MKPLYEIANEYLHAYDELMSMEELPLEIIENTLKGIQATFEQKAINVAAFIKNLDAEAEAIEKAEKEMKKRRQVAEKRAEDLRNYLAFNLSVMKMNSIRISPMFNISLRNNPPKLIIDNKSLIPNNYKTIEIVEVVDNKTVKSLLKKGEEVPGAHLQYNKSVLIK